MSDDNTMDFSKLNLQERIVAVDNRLGDHTGRISHPHQLLDLVGETIYLVVSPFGKDQNISNCFMLTWDVGAVSDHRGNPVEKDKELKFDDDEKYICFSHSDPQNIISLKDFNIIPNSYNNHAAFKNKEDAEAYTMYRKMCFAEDSSITELEGDYAYFFSQEDLERLLKSEKQAKSS